MRLIDNRFERPRQPSAALAAMAIACATAATACGGPGLVAPLARAPELPGDQARCRVAASRENPLVTEWPAPEKANLEARLREGPVVVSYTGCSLRMLPRCRARGGYEWRRTTTSTDVVEIRNADELYAKMPLGAVSLEGELERSGRLAVQTTVSGQLQLTRFDVAGLVRGGDCEGATHVLGSLSVGAFKLRSGGKARAGAKVDVAGVASGGGSSSSEETTVREAGLPARCERSTPEAADPECASPLQMFLQPLPSTLVDRGPIGTVNVKFLPVRADEKWNVVVGDRKICETPCDRWVDPAVPYSLKYDPGFWRPNEYVEIPDLRPHAVHERLEVRVQTRHMAEFVGGVLITTFAGASAAAGTVLTAAGCGKGGGVCTAGLITLPIGLLALVPGIWMIVDSEGMVHVTPAGPQAAPRSARLAGRPKI